MWRIVPSLVWWEEEGYPVHSLPAPLAAILSPCIQHTPRSWVHPVPPVGVMHAGGAAQRRVRVHQAHLRRNPWVRASQRPPGSLSCYHW